MEKTKNNFCFIFLTTAVMIIHRKKTKENDKKY